MSAPARLAPEIALPPYAYVPGTALPHPTGDPRGHSFGKTHVVAAAPLAESWTGCTPYLYGIDLFNYGYYWEAHESWEPIWRTCERNGTVARFLKGLIKLAAAGVKMREGRQDGVVSHARRAAELFRSVAGDLNGATSKYMGLMVGDLISQAEDTVAGGMTSTLLRERRLNIKYEIREFDVR